MGGLGDDTLVGEDGNDRFLFAGDFDTDMILEIEDNTDTIELVGASLGVTSRAEALSHAGVVKWDTVFTFAIGDKLETSKNPFRLQSRSNLFKGLDPAEIGIREVFGGLQLIVEDIADPNLLRDDLAIV